MKTKRSFLFFLLEALVLTVLTLTVTDWANGDQPPRVPSTGWTGNAGDSKWSTPGNWDNGIPQDGDKVDLITLGTVILDTKTSAIHELYIKGMTLNHTGNTLTMDGVWNYLGIDNGGIYNFSGGTIVKPGYEVKIGGSDAGKFIQSGESIFQFSGDMYLGDKSTGVGTYEMTGGSIIAGSSGKGSIVLGERGGTGTFNQSGESSVDINDLILAGQKGAQGFYNLTGGNLNAATETTVGKAGTGVFDLKEGSHSTGSLAVGSYGVIRNSDDVITELVKGTGEYKIGHHENGTFLNVGGTLTIGEGGSGTFTQSGGKVTVNGNLVLGRNGYLFIDEEDLSLYGDGTFIQTGGTNTINNTLIIAQEPGSTGSYDFQDGTLDANYIINNGSFTNKGGDLSFHTFSGTGTVYDHLDNYSIVSPGNSPGTLTIDGDYIQYQEGILYIELGGADQGTSYDWLNITGGASLAGILEVVLWGEDEGSIFTPSYGDTFDILTALSISGAFDFENSVLPEGYNWSIDYLDLNGSDGLLDTVQLTANAVPIPGALWLLGSGIAAIIVIPRKVVKGKTGTLGYLTQHPF